MIIPRGPVAVAVSTLALLIGSLVATVPGPAVDTVLPPAPAPALQPADVTLAAEHAALGIRVTAGWHPRHVMPEADPWALFDGADGVRAWRHVLPRLRVANDAQGRLLVEDAVVLSDPGPCYHVARIVRGVSVGLPEPQGSAVAREIEGWLAPPYFSAVRVPAGSGPCRGRDRSHWGFAIEQVEPLACTVPGRDVLCVTLATWRYDFGRRDEWTSTRLVFDTSDGMLLDDASLHPDLDLAAFDGLVADVVCAAGGRCDGLAPRDGRLHPTATAIAVELSPGEGADAQHGSLRVSIPRRLLPTLPDGTGGS